jgi:hypothetical protein
MSNVVSFFGNQEASIFGDYGPADFDIATEPLFYSLSKDKIHPVRQASKNVVYRTDTGAELGIHGSKYQAVAPKKLIDAQRAIILRSNLNTDDIREEIQTSHDGSRTFVKYTLPNHTYRTPDGDNASLVLLGITSFDSSWPFMMSVAAHQFACLNLQVFSRGEITVFKARHTKNLDVDHGSRLIVKALDFFQAEQETWHTWSKTNVTEQEAKFIFSEAAGCVSQVKTLIEDGASWSDIFESLSRSNSSLSYLARQWPEYRDRLGKNRWAVYNTLTDWSTHAPAARKASEINIASVRHKRQEQVRKTLNSNIWLAKTA